MVLKPSLLIDLDTTAMKVPISDPLYEKIANKTMRSQTLAIKYKVNFFSYVKEPELTNLQTRMQQFILSSLKDRLENRRE